MKDIVPKAERIRNEALKLRLPKDFIWKLYRNIIDDLGFLRTATDDSPEPAYADIDISSFLDAIKNRDVGKLSRAYSEFGLQRIVQTYDHRMDAIFAVSQVVALLKKYPFDGDNCKQKAKSTFRLFEHKALLFNRENWRALKAVNDNHPDFLDVIEELRNDISLLLGNIPNVTRVYDCAKHGPGTALGFEDMGDKVTPYFKWSNLPYTVSEKAIPYAKSAILSDPQWIGALMNHYREVNDIPMWSPIDMDSFWASVLEVRNYCRYSSVPKTSETDRSIAIEPTLNVYLQLGVDRIIRSRLRKRWHVDLNSQAKNQKMAKESSVTGESVTIDLKGASELVTMMICFLLLPPGWFDLLCDLRSEFILIDGKKVPLQKMSAMGNGFTFALESLIFTAITRCAIRRTKSSNSYSVFGDDIIAPKTATKYLLDLLSLCGFEINDDKSFVSGPFRESCGVDCVRGIDIRPLYLKRPVETVMDLWYIHNSLQLIEKKLPWAWCFNFSKTRAWLRQFIPKKFRDCVGPPSESVDTYLFGGKKPLCSPAGIPYHPVVTSRVIELSSRGSDFFFRKLMNRLKGSSTDWLGFTNATEGSAYDITMRGTVRYYLTARRVWR